MEPAASDLPCEELPEQPACAPESPRGTSWPRRALGGLGRLLWHPVFMAMQFPLLAAAVAWPLYRLHLDISPRLRACELPLLAILLLGAGFVFLREYRRWVRPTRRLARLLAEIRGGEAPIEELTRVEGGLRPLAEVLAGLMHDLRSERQQVAILNDEIRQRVAQRTDALERMLGTLRQQAARDVLTGLFNRRALDEHLPRLMEECRSSGNDLGLLMIDLDHFKHVNDTLGHPAGDALLADVGRLIRSSLRDSDLAFRFGGDEFCVLLPGRSPASAAALGQRLTALGRSLGQTLHLEPAPSLSIGLACLSAHPVATPAELLKAADDALYTHKTIRRSA